MRHLTNWRVYALTLMGIAAMVLLLGEPEAGSLSEWLAVFVVSKAAAAALLVAVHRLAAKWADKLPDLGINL